MDISQGARLVDVIVFRQWKMWMRILQLVLEINLQIRYERVTFVMLSNFLVSSEVLPFNSNRSLV